MPRIALIVLSYNRGRLMTETLASVAAQDVPLTALERMYLADDCSSDGTPDIAQRFWRDCATRQAVPPLEVITGPVNVGQWPSLNRAVRHAAATHDWVLVLHDDDLVKPHWLRLTLAAIDAADARTISVCSSWDMLRDDGGVEPGEDRLDRVPETIPGTRAAVSSTVMKGCWWHISGCAIRTAGFLSVGDFDPAFQYAADEEWLLRSLDAGQGFIYLPRTLLVYRAHESAVSSMSLRLGTDLSEQVRMFARYGRAVSRSEARRFHTRLLTRTGRRTASAVLQLRWRTALRIGALVPRILASAAGATSQTRQA